MKTFTPYKTAEELGIEQWEHDGLVALIGPLSRGELEVDMGYPTRPKSFEDPDWDHPTLHCGTCHCIGGWLAFREGMVTRDEIGDYVHSKDYDGEGLQSLFFPNELALFEATAPQAARAIINFLTIGDPRWDDVMRGPSIADFDADDSGSMIHVVETEDA